MHIAEGKVYSGKIKLLKVDSSLITPYGHMSDQMHLSVLSTEKQSRLHILIIVRNYIIKEFRFIGGGLEIRCITIWKTLILICILMEMKLQMPHSLQ